MRQSIKIAKKLTSLLLATAMVISCISVEGIVRASEPTREEQILADYRANGQWGFDLTNVTTDASVLFSNTNSSADFTADATNGLAMKDVKYYANLEFNMDLQAPTIEGKMKLDTTVTGIGNSNLHFYFTSDTDVSNGVQIGNRDKSLIEVGMYDASSRQAQSRPSKPTGFDGTVWFKFVLEKDGTTLNWQVYYKLAEADNWTTGKNSSTSSTGVDASKLTTFAISGKGNTYLQKLKVTYPVTQQAKAFKATYTSVLAKTEDTVKETDLTDIQKALAEYDTLSENSKQSLTEEKSHLEALETKLTGHSKYDELVENGIYTQNFENGSDFGVYAEYAGVSSDHVEVATDFTKNGVLTGVEGNNHALQITNSNARTGFGTADAEKYGQFITADKALWTAMAKGGKYLSSGSFDMFMTAGNNKGNTLNINYMFEDVYNYNFYGLFSTTTNNVSMSSQVMGARVYHMTGDESNHTSANWGLGLFDDEGSPKGENIAHMAYPENQSGKWFHFEFFYDAEGHFEIFGVDERGYIISYARSAQTNDPIAKEKRILSFGRMGQGNFYIDNIEYRFTKDGIGTASNEVLALLQQQSVREAMELNTEVFVPYDFARANAYIEKYNALSADAKAIAPKVLGAKVSALQTAMGNWDTTSDEAIAASFYTITDGMAASKALSMYNRLTKAQRALLATEYATLKTTVGEATPNSVVNVSCVGASITYGTSLAEPTTESYPAQLQALLGSGYNVGKFGVPGISVLQIPDVRIGTEGQYRDSMMFDESIIHNPDLVIILMGHNDMRHLKSAFEQGNGDKYLALMKVAYTDLVQDYLAQEGSPTIMIGNLAYWKETQTDYNPTIEKYSTILREIAEEYNLGFIDTYAITSAWSDDEKAERYDNDKLHFNTTGYGEIAKEMYAFIQKTTTEVSTESGNIIDFSKAINAQYAPDILGATIQTNGGRMEFGSKMGYKKTSVDLVEYGTIFTYAQYVYGTNPSVTLEDMVWNSNNELVTKTTSDEVANLATMSEFSGRTFALNKDLFGYRILARSYVRYSDGSVYYSDNTTQDGSAKDGVGVENGYVSRSVVNVAQNIMKAVYAGKDETILNATVKDGIETYLTHDGTKFNWTDAAKENGGIPVVTFLNQNDDNICEYLATLQNN